MKQLLSIALILLLVIGCAAPAVEAPKAETPAPAETEVAAPVELVETPQADDPGFIILSTTTSTQDSGLLDEILPDFTQKTGIEVKVVAVGTGAAIKNGQEGNADVLLVHAKADEEKFVAEGYGLERFDVMYNDFVIVGPPNGPQLPKSPADALKYIAEHQLPFVSRGDDSGTHKKELALWKLAGIDDPGASASEWYQSAGKGMGDVLTMANELKAYTLADRATYLSMKDKLDLVIVVEGDSSLYNQYGVIAVSSEKHPKVNQEGAQAFVDWIISEPTQKLIAEFGKDKFGESLFIPNAK